MFSGSYMSQSLGGSITPHGQYDFGGVNVPPKVSASYTNSSSDSYTMPGSLLGQNLNVPFPSSNYNVASFTASNEFNKVLTTAGGSQFMPYAEFGVQYDAIRVDNGQVLTGALGFATPSACTMTVRSGVRMFLSNTIQIDLGTGYSSWVSMAWTSSTPKCTCPCLSRFDTASPSLIIQVDIFLL